MRVRSLEVAGIAAVMVAIVAYQERSGPQSGMFSDSVVIVAEARALLSTNARELEAGGVDAIAARYDTTGASGANPR